MNGHQGAQQTPVTVDLADLRNGTVPLSLLEEAFGPSSLGILLVKGLPPPYPELRHRLLSYSSYLASLPGDVLETLEVPSAKYLTGWSRGKETLKSGRPDDLKGSYYVNCAEFYPHKPSYTSPSHPSNPTPIAPPTSDLAATPEPAPTSPNPKQADIHSTTNVWPPPQTLPGFKPAVTELCSLVIDVAVLVARACDLYARANIDGYREGWLERVVKGSDTNKARLLHYYPPSASPGSRSSADGEGGGGDAERVINGAGSKAENRKNEQEEEEEENEDDWCATHLDHGCLTGLTSAMYIDEAASPPFPFPGPSSTKSPTPSPSNNQPSPPPPQPLLEISNPSQTGGLYIHTRTGSPVQVKIPRDCLAFQTGEALELITRGKFKAVPHFVRAGGRGGGDDGGGDDVRREDEDEGDKKKRTMRVARNTLAVFTQPCLDEVVDERRGVRFGDFVSEVVRRNA